ncbi:hypothetical protein, partial [Bradyrhizobium sp.]|uniref:hypothetical protein n=1 Tax=Bradyrhizobium sp. TaxID=376 RepID=UPI003C34E9F7
MALGTARFALTGGARLAFTSGARLVLTSVTWFALTVARFALTTVARFALTNRLATAAGAVARPWLARLVVLLGHARARRGIHFGARNVLSD